MDHGVVQRWLREVVQPYHDADRVYADLDRTLVAVSSLSPKTEVYTYDDGRTQLLILLSGTIPIQYRTATYNIPIDVWMPRVYPREPPIVYVRPTNDMLVRKGKSVDVSGRVGGDYLQRWERKWESCNLLELVHSCQEVFGQEPPVYAKPKQVSAAGPSSASPTPSSSRSTFDPRERAPPPQPGSSSRDAAPLRPPKSTGSSSAYDSNHFPPSPSNAGWTVSPRQSVSSGTFANQEPPLPNGRGWERSPDSRQGSWHDGHLPVWSRPNTEQQAHRSSSIQSNTSTHEVTAAAAAPPLVAPPPPGQRPHQVTSPIQQPPSSTLPTPLRPPNPELLQMHATLHHKVQTRLQHLRTTVGDSQHQLRLLISDLDRGEPAIRDEMARLEAVRDVCRATGNGMEEAVQRARDRIEELKNRSEPDVDGMICATSIVGNQLIDLVAEDSAIGDTLFFLGQALHSEVVEVDKFLKQTRFLAREQFLRRALAQKITQGMGW